jgi:hypothetical protein
MKRLLTGQYCSFTKISCVWCSRIKLGNKGVYFRGLPFFRKINAWLSAAHRSKPAFFSASDRFMPGGISRASCRASTAMALWLRLSGEGSCFDVGPCVIVNIACSDKKILRERGWVPTQDEKLGGSVSVLMAMVQPYDLATGWRVVWSKQLIELQRRSGHNSADAGQRPS